eukprot:765317-Hanusia_phi.AAC.1
MSGSQRPAAAPRCISPRLYDAGSQRRETWKAMKRRSGGAEGRGEEEQSWRGREESLEGGYGGPVQLDHHEHSGPTCQILV